MTFFSERKLAVALYFAVLSERSSLTRATTDRAHNTQPIAILQTVTWPRRWRENPPLTTHT